MELRSLMHSYIDELDEPVLEKLYHQMQVYIAESDQVNFQKVPSIEQVLRLTSSDTSDWSSSVIQERLESR